MFYNWRGKYAGIEVRRLKQLKELTFKPNGLSLTAQIPSLPYGTYAIATYQDVNDNGHIDQNLIGLPKEPYAFSNNYKPKIKAPNFVNCKFIYDSTAHSTEIRMLR